MFSALCNVLLESKVCRYVEIGSEEAKTLADLCHWVESGWAKTLVMIGGNPAYDAPVLVGSGGETKSFKDLLKNIPESVRVGLYHDETAVLADVVIAQSHYLESWGDGRTFDGDYVPVQPVIIPLFETLGTVEIWELLLGKDNEKKGYDSVKETFKAWVGKDPSDLAFKRWLAEGVQSADGLKAVPWSGSFRERKLSEKKFLQKLGKLESLKDEGVLNARHLEVRFVPSSHTKDGRFHNNAWMMECPDPISRLTWDNAVMISPRLAKELGINPQASQMVKKGQMRPNANTFKKGAQEALVATLSLPDRGEVEGPLHVQPGLADYTIVLSLGFGRKETGRVGRRLDDSGLGVGFDVYPLRFWGDREVAYGGSLTLTGKTFPLANVQEHWSMEGRAIVREANLSEHLKDQHWVEKMGAEAHSPPIYRGHQKDPIEDKVRQIPRGFSMYQTPPFDQPSSNVKAWKGAEDKFPIPQQWGMSIDLNTCIGCHACVVACQSENNIPVVGKDQVLRGREMHWIRLDRYYSSSASFDEQDLPEDPQVLFMSVACVHCELAPCESVCPVNATVHDEQGLNVMAYNRCVGTRYCSNNCPYKVRRFNFFDYHKRERGHYYEGPFGSNRYKKDEGRLSAMHQNPDVTVRMRGVMEKCTYCVQRIESAKIRQKIKSRQFRRYQGARWSITNSLSASMPHRSDNIW